MFAQKLCTSLIILSLPALALAEEKQATTVVAQSDVNTIATQMEQVAAFTNFFTTIENLDDLTAPTTTFPFDYINDNGGALVISPFTGDFRDDRLDYLNRPLGLSFNGPYISAFSNLISVGRFTDDTHFYDDGHPLDPWFNPYLFYSPLGLVVPRTESIELDLHGDSFDRFTIVSLGPDGVVSGDDIIRSISGFSITTLAISSARLRSSSAKQSAYPYQLVIKGYNFGSTQGTGTVTIDSVSAPIISWSGTEVIAGLNSLPASNASVELTTDTGASKSYTGYVDERPDTDVRDWELYY